MISTFYQSQLKLLASTAIPVILNGTFADTSNWTITSGGGAASMTITSGSPGILTSLSGSGNSAATCIQTLSGLVSGQTYTLTYDTTGYLNGAISVSLGGGSPTSIGGVVGTGHTITIVAGSSNQDIKMNPLSGIGGRTVSITNLILS